GTPTSRCPCWPRPTSPPPAPPNTNERRKRGTHSRPDRRRRRPDPVEQQRDPPPARHPRPRPRDLRADRPALVDLATPTTAPGPNMPLPPTRPSTTVTTNCRCSTSSRALESLRPPCRPHRRARRLRPG